MAAEQLKRDYIVHVPARLLKHNKLGRDAKLLWCDVLVLDTVNQHECRIIRSHVGNRTRLRVKTLSQITVKS